MSYSKQYQASVPFNGSVSYHYPASQNGGSGTAHYSGHVPVNVTINVNTAPFDGSVDYFNASVDTLTGSVVAMNAAQCAAIQKTTEEVSQSLIKGFFGTIKTELSQQLQALDSAIKAGFGLIQEQGKAVAVKKTQMEHDYNRISSRYVTLFADLDKECYKRIYALDKQSFTLSEKVQRQLLSESPSNTAALNLLGVEEESSSKILLFVSGLNRKALNVLNTLRDYITQEIRINSLIDSFLFSEESGENIPLYVPVVWTESDMPDGGAVNHESFVTGHLNIGPDGKQAIAEKVNAFCSGSSAWKPLEEPERDALNREFNILAEKHFSGADEETEQRVYKTMLSLWQNSEIFSL